MSDGETLPQKFLAAAVQLTCTEDRAENLRRALDLVDEAARRGARLVALPENVDFIGPPAEKRRGAEDLDGPLLRAFAERAARHRLVLLAGTFAERAGDGRIHNTAVLFGPDGRRLAAYRKIHLFDADPPDGVRYRESELVAAGSEVVAAATPLGTVGLSVCYDLRFPELYRTLAARGADVLLVPAAFTVPTGRAHWEVLLRARAIENLAFVVAPAQVGAHGGERRSYGHALVVDPWGEVLADAGGDMEGLALAELDRSKLEEARRRLPALTHRRL